MGLNCLQFLGIGFFSNLGVPCAAAALLPDCKRATNTQGHTFKGYTKQIPFPCVIHPSVFGTARFCDYNACVRKRKVEANEAKIANHENEHSQVRK